MGAEVASSVERVRLAAVAPFDIGRFRIAPALRRVEGLGIAETLEPRVMQVLVALAQPLGAVVSRDELVERCWDGRVVGDNAISRAISRLRHLAAKTDPPAFAIETIPRVGYRLAPGASASRDRAGESGAPPRRSRRDVLAAALAVGAGAAGLAWRLAGVEPVRRSPPLAEAYYQRGQEAQRQRTFDGKRQALAFFRRATEIDPDHAGAWGALALAHRNMMESTGGAELETVAAASRSAARRALDLDPNNADALTAIALVRPAFRRWASREDACRTLLRRFPDKSAPAAALAGVLCDVGRWREALAVLRPLVARDPFLPSARAELALCLWNTGEVEEADRVSEEAMRFWPANDLVWMTRFNLLALTGREDAAVAFVTADNGVTRPSRPPMPPILCLLTARALAGRAPADISRIADAVMAGWRAHSVSSIQAAVHLAAFGALDPAFEVLDGFFHGRRATGGARFQPPSPLTERSSDFLFWRVAAPLRRDQRFAPLARAIGLGAYWRETGTRPDF